MGSPCLVLFAGVRPTSWLMSRMRFFFSAHTSSAYEQQHQQQQQQTTV
jgi:hypothetical protein